MKKSPNFGKSKIEYADSSIAQSREFKLDSQENNDDDDYDDEYDEYLNEEDDDDEYDDINESSKTFSEIFKQKTKDMPHKKPTLRPENLTK